MDTNHRICKIGSSVNTTEALRIFSTRLITERRKKFKFARGLEDALGMSHGQVARYEMGHTYPYALSLFMIAKELDVCAYYLMGITDEIRPFNLNEGKKDEIKIQRCACCGSVKP